EVTARRVPGRAEPRDEERRRSAGLPHGLRIGLGVIGDRRGDREPDDDAEAEQEEDRELLRRANGELDAEEAGDRGDEPDPPPAVRHVAPEVCAEREQRRRDCDQAHRLAEQGTSLVASWGALESRVLEAHPRELSAGALRRRFVFITVLLGAPLL